MDDVVYWFGLIARLLLFLVLIRLCVWGVVWVVERVWGVKVGAGGWRLMGVDTLSLHSSTYELEVYKVFVSVKWFDPTCRHFFKVNVGRLHVDCALFPPESDPKRAAIKPKPRPPQTKPSVWKRFLYWLLRFIAKRVEVCVSNVEVYVHDAVDRNIDFLSVLEVKGHVSILAQPMPDKMLAVSLEVDSASGQFLMHSEKSASPQDHYSPLMEVQCSSRVFLYLQPLTRHGSTLASVQVNTAPLSCTWLQEGAFRYAVQHFNSYLPSKSTGNRSSAASEPLDIQAIQLPKMEIVLEDVSLHHQVKGTNRVISSTLSRLSLELSGNSATEVGVGGGDHSGLCTMVGLQDLSATDSLSREFLTLKQLRLKSKYESCKLSNVLQVESLHSTLREEEAVYWGRYFAKSMTSLRQSSSGQKPRRSSLSSSPVTGKGIPDLLQTMMSSAVTTVEATDWSVSLRMDAPTLQAKEPLVQAVLASCAVNLQWTEPTAVKDKSTAIARASLRLEDAYLHVPGYHPSTSSDPFLFRQRPDDPTVLPSLHRHQWGHLLALGNLMLKVEKPITVECTPGAEGGRQQEEEGGEREKDTMRRGVAGESENVWKEEAVQCTDAQERGGQTVQSSAASGWSWRKKLFNLLLAGEPAVVAGEGSSLMLEWSTPTAVALLRTLQHLKQHYKLFSKTGANVGRGGVVSGGPKPLAESALNEGKEDVHRSTAVSQSGVPSGNPNFADVVQGLSEVALSFQFTDTNAFVYGLTPEAPALMMRLDAVSVSSPQSTPSPPPSLPPSSASPTPSLPAPSLSPSLQLHLHGLLLDSLSLVAPTSSFLCSALASLPTGVGVGVVNSLDIRYQHNLKEMTATMSRVDANWSPTHHLSLFHVITDVWNGIKKLGGVLRPKVSSGETVIPRSQVVSIGEKMSKVIASVPLSLVLNLENAVCQADVGRSSRVSLVLQTCHCLLRNKTVVADMYELGVVFDKQRIVTLENLKAVFPREGSGGEAERKKMKMMERETNPAIDLSATRTKLTFPYQYKFGATFDKVLNVKKYLQKLHGGTSDTAPLPLPFSLPPDVHLQCGEVLLQLCEDPFEAKLRANYELMCDEYEQKLERLKALDQKVEELKHTQGEFNVSAKKIRSLYDSLVVKGCQIYCRRAQELHSSPDAGREELMVFSFERIQLWAMFDPSMLGRERVVGHMHDMDDISPFPEGSYEFSTLWGMYVSGDTGKLQIQLRDYPHPLLQGTEWRASGRMIFAEQEAQDRETRSAVVELSHPWKNVVVQRKLPPLKYYYDLDMESATFVWTYGPCLEPVMAQTNTAFNFLTNPTIDPSRPLAYWDKFRLLFHGCIHLLSKKATILLPATFDPYNTVSYVELILGNLHTNLITNARLELEGSLQVYVHNATKYDDCEIANFPHVKTCMLCSWVCAGKEPHDHHAVRRCAPDKIPVLPDKQVHDSYSAFRSHNVDVDWTIQVLPQKDTDPNPPSLLLFFSTLRWLQFYSVTLSSNVTRPIRKGSYWKVIRKHRRPPLLRHWRNLKISATFPKSVLTLWTSVAKQRGVECVIDSGNVSISYLITLTPFTDGLIRRPSRSLNIVSFSGDVKDLIVYVESSVDQLPKVSDEEEDGEMPDLLIQNDMALDEEEEEEEEEEEGDLTRTVLGYTAELSYKRLESEDSSNSDDQALFLTNCSVRERAWKSRLHQEFTHQVKVHNTRILLNSSNKQIVLGLYDSLKQAQMLKRDLSAEALKSLVTILEPATNTENITSSPKGTGESPEHKEATTTPSGSRPTSARLHRHSSSGNVMLDQLLKDLSNKLTVAEDISTSSQPPLKGVHLANAEDIRHKNWLIEMTNIQVALQGIENWGYVVASSNIAQVFGREHQPVLNEGDLVSKKSWLASVQDLQYFSTFGSAYKGRRIPWLPLSVISSPLAQKQESSPSAVVPEDSESNLNALLSQLGPAETVNEREIKGAKVPPGEAVGGLVNCLLIQADKDGGRQELRGGSVRGALLQRIASRCHCNVIYVSYGGQAETDAGKISHAINSPNKSSPGLAETSSEAVDTLTIRYPNVEICTTSAQQALITDVLTNLLLHNEPRKKEALDHHAHMQFMVQLSDIQDPRKPVLVQQNKVRRCLQTIRTLEHEMFVTQQMEVSEEEEQQLESSLAAAKDDLSEATMRLRAMIRAFKESRLLPQAGQFSDFLSIVLIDLRILERASEAPEPVHRIEIWLDDAHWWLTQKDGQLQIADIQLTNFSYNRVSFRDDSGEHRLELGTFQVQNLTPNTPTIYQQVLVPYDPKSRRLRVDRNICLRMYCRDKARVAGITVREHLEVNVVPLQVSLTARFFQTMQDFFFPKAEGEGPDPGPVEPDHSHLFGVQPTHTLGVDMADGNVPLLQRGASSRRSTASLTSSASHSSLQHVQSSAGYSPPTSPGPKESRKGKHLSLSHLDTVAKMKERASHINTFIYVKIPQTTLCITYKGENWSYKDLQNQVMNMPTLEYHSRNWTWKDMLMEVKKDYKNAIIHQTLRSAIGMRESEESSGLASPKLLRHTGDLLLGKAKSSKVGKGKKLFGKLSSTKEDSDSDREVTPRSASPVYQPPLRDPEPNLKRTYQKLTKLSQDAQK